MGKFSAASLVLAAACLLGACAAGLPGNAPAPGPEKLAGSGWHLLDFAGQSMPGRRATLAFPEPGRVAGSSFCNRFGGPIVFAAGGVRIGPLAGTRMACVPDLGTQETRYLEALQNAERLALEGDALLVYSRGLDKPLRYGRAAP